MDTQFLEEELICMGSIALILAAFVSFRFLWRTRSCFDTKFDKLRSCAERLKLEVLNTEGVSLYQAVADQLSILNPQGSYTAGVIEEKIKRNEKTSFLKMVIRNLNFWKKEEVWRGYLEELNIVADAYTRIIEVVHIGRKETTVIRPGGSGVTRHMQTVYIGYDGEGGFYSLRPESKIDSSEKRPKEKSLNNTNAAKVQNNVSIGDDAKQYILELPKDHGEEYPVTKNIVVGNNTSQNILVTYRTPKEVLDLINEMESSGVKGSDHKLRLKIREISNTLSEEELTKKHQRIVELLEDKDNEIREELEGILKEFSLTYEKASLGCILLCMEVDTLEKLIAFIASFRAGNLEKIMMVIAGKPCDNASSYDVQLQMSIILNATESQKLSNLHRFLNGNENEDKVSKPKYMSSGFSMVLSHKTDKRQDPLASQKEFARALSEATCESLSKFGLLLDTSEMEFSFEKFCSQKAGTNTNKPSRKAVLESTSNMMSECMRGSIGVIRNDDGISGTCFRVGSTYVMTALHVVKAALTKKGFDDNRLIEENVFVEFHDDDEKHHAKVEYFDEDIDVAVLRLSTENTKAKRLNLVFECQPGHSFYTLTHFQSLGKAKRSIIASTDYVANFISTELVLFESDEFEYGCSGSPGITTNVDGETGLITMLLGSMTTSTDAFYYGVKMTDVKKRITNENQYLANALFGPSDHINKTLSPHLHKGTRNKIGKHDSMESRERSTRINGS